MDVIKIIKKNCKLFKKITAVEEKDKNYSYKDFWILMNNVASKLLNVKAKPIVVIIGKQNILSYVSIFGTLLSGGTYIPISISSPLNRIVNIIKLSKCNIVICENKQKKYLKKIFPNKKFLIDHKLFITKPIKNIEIKKKNRIAYIIFTSGSTGEPKGVCISREALNCYIEWITKIFQIKQGSKCSQFPQIGFDLSVADIFGTLCSGGTLVPASHKLDNFFPGRFIKNKKISHLVCVPSLIETIKDSKDLNFKNFKSVKMIFFCGEPLLYSQVKSIFQSKKNIKLINAYGPTEATCSCTFKILTSSNFRKLSGISMSIGKPNPKIKISLNQTHSKKIINNREGEIIISGPQVADGYLNSKENVNKFTKEKKIRSFRTGDYGKIVNNNLYFVGRIDNQIKLKGHRIELNEIDFNLRKIGFSNSSSIFLEKKIISFVIDNRKRNKSNTLKKLSKHIPDYMMPSNIITIKQMPIGQNGKINRKQLIQLAKKNNNFD